MDSRLNNILMFYCFSFLLCSPANFLAKKKKMEFVHSEVVVLVLIILLLKKY